MSNELVRELDKATKNLEDLLTDLPPIASHELLRACIVDEIVQTNQIEGIFSTRKDVFRIIDDARVSKKEKTRSIANKYYLLLHQAPENVLCLQDVRRQYDQLMLDALNPRDIPDGEYFRKNSVSVADGARIVHNGLFPEKVIQNAIQVYLDMINGDDLHVFEKLAATHYIF